jgi:hypothetical protein
MLQSTSARVAAQQGLVRPGELWQRNYHEHVIRDADEADAIQQYIVDNPMQWELDRENPRRKGLNPFYEWLEMTRRT